MKQSVKTDSPCKLRTKIRVRPNSIQQRIPFGKYKWLEEIRLL